MPALPALGPPTYKRKREPGPGHGLWAAAAFALCLLLWASPATAQAPGLSGLKFSDGTVSLELKDAPAGRLLEELGKKGGFKVKLRGDVDKIKLSDSLKYLTMQEALRRLLLGQNYLMTTDSSGAVTSVLLIATEPGQAAAVRRLPNRPSGRTPGASAGRVTHVGESTAEAAKTPAAAGLPPKATVPRAVDTRDGRSPTRRPVRRNRP